MSWVGVIMVQVNIPVIRDELVLAKQKRSNSINDTRKIERVMVIKFCDRLGTMNQHHMAKYHRELMRDEAKSMI